MTAGRVDSAVAPVWGLLGVPSSAAAHWPGIEKAPAALRAAGILEVLRAEGISVTDHGDLPVARWRSHRPDQRPNDSTRVAEGLREIDSAVCAVIDDGHRPLLLGGECTVVVGVMSALARRGVDTGLIYVDGGQDLMIPRDHPSEPILDGMGVAHLLDLPGVVDEIAGVGPRRPLLTPSRLAFVGFADEEEDIHGLVPSVRFPGIGDGGRPDRHRVRRDRGRHRSGGVLRRARRCGCPRFPRHPRGGRAELRPRAHPRPTGAAVRRLGERSALRSNDIRRTQSRSRGAGRVDHGRSGPRPGARAARDRPTDQLRNVSAIRQIGHYLRAGSTRREFATNTPEPDPLPGHIYRSPLLQLPPCGRSCPTSTPRPGVSKARAPTRSGRVSGSVEHHAGRRTLADAQPTARARAAARTLLT